MYDSDETIAKAQRRDHRVPRQLKELEGRITGYVLTRLANDLKGLPGHPKWAGRIGLSHIAVATGVPVHDLFHPQIKGHLDRLAALHGIETPDDRAQRLALAQIEGAYSARPVPVRGRKPHLSAIRLETGIAVLRLKTEACQALLRELIGRNGVVRPKVDHAEELERLAAYGDNLLAMGARLPAKPGRSGPSPRKVARAIGISPDRFARPHLMEALDRLARTIGVEAHPTTTEDAERFRSFVDARIAVRDPVPLSRGRVGHRAIAEMTNIQAQRIANDPRMQRDVKRWLAAVGMEDIS